MRVHVDFVDATSERELIMPVRLDGIPPPAMRPAPPRVWLWFIFLLLSLACSAGSTVLPHALSSDASAFRFDGMALVAPVLVWGLLCGFRFAVASSSQCEADGWNEAREQDLLARMRRGRRSQQVLAASLYTALREAGAGPDQQIAALESAQVARRSQLSRRVQTFLHSRLADDIDAPLESLVAHAMKRLLDDLAPSLAALPADTPLELLMTFDSGVSNEQLQQLWREAWRASGIRQTPVAVEGDGLATVDLRLDQRITDQSVLMVVALQMASSNPDGTAEVAVGLLLGNGLTQHSVTPIACLHRPEQARGSEEEPVCNAFNQALDWVPLEASSIARLWRTGIDEQRVTPIASAMSGVLPCLERKDAVVDIDALLGQSGPAGAWLAIAAATQAIQRGSGPQFVVSGDLPAEAGIWCTVVAPVPSHRKRDF
jgi:hypothetical protein